jgi:putative FmdB family regulatory protein
MPLFEYECRECGERFEALVVESRQAECPKCKSRNLQKLISTFSAGAGSGPSPAPRSGGGCGSSFGGG